MGRAVQRRRVGWGWAGVAAAVADAREVLAPRSGAVVPPRPCSPPGAMGQALQTISPAGFAAGGTAHCGSTRCAAQG